MSARGVALVTGGSRGIGAAVARRLAAAGWSIGVLARERGDAALGLLESLDAGGARAVAIACDVGAPADVERAFDAVERALGPVAALVNCAGVTGPPGRLADAPAEAIEAVLRTNVLGTILCARAAVRRMSTARGGAGGAIVNLSSGAARTGSPGSWVHYAASKGAVDTFTVGLAREVAREGIRVNAVRAGPTATRMLLDGDPARLDASRRAVPLGRLAEPDEIAAAVAWLLGPDAAFVTGALLDATGGL